MQTSIAPLTFALLLSILAGCDRKDPRDLSGTWSITVHSSDSMANNRKLSVEMRKDGTYTLTGDLMFTRMLGRKEAKGTWAWKGENSIHVTMEPNALGFRPTTYTMQEIAGDELVFDTSEYSLTFIRE